MGGNEGTLWFKCNCLTFWKHDLSVIRSSVNFKESHYCEVMRGTAAEGIVVILRGLLASSVKRIIMSE